MTKFDIVIYCTECDDDADGGRILCPICYEKLEDKIADLEEEVEELNKTVNADADEIEELEQILAERTKERDALIQLVNDLKAANEGGVE